MLTYDEDSLFVTGLKEIKTIKNKAKGDFFEVNNPPNSNESFFTYLEDIISVNFYNGDYLPQNTFSLKYETGLNLLNSPKGYTVLALIGNVKNDFYTTNRCTSNPNSLFLELSEKDSNNYEGRYSISTDANFNAKSTNERFYDK